MQPPLRVVQMVTSTAFSGIERHVLHSSVALNRLGCESTIAAPKAALRLREEAAAAGLSVRSLAESFARPRDVLHLHDGRAALLAAVVPRPRSVRVVRTQHFLDPASAGREGWRASSSLALHRYLNKRADVLVAISTAVADAAIERREVDAAKVVVVPPAVELASAEVVEAARHRRIALKTPAVIFAGRLVAERRLDVLLRAIPSVWLQEPTCRFVFAGRGEDADALKRLAEDLQLDERVEWPGFNADPDDAFASAHAYVNTWSREGFGMAMVEAMAMELPVVAADGGSSADIVQPGVTGMLAIPDDAESFAAAIVEVLRDREGAATMGRAGRARALELFGAERTAEQTFALYRRLRVVA